MTDHFPGFILLQGWTNTIRSTDCSQLYFRRSLFILLQGWNIGQGGPTLLDLQIVANCTLEEASLFCYRGRTLDREDQHY